MQLSSRDIIPRGHYLYEKYNATQSNVESGKTFSTASLDNASGSMAVMSGQTITPTKSVQTISCSGKKMNGNITINAIPSNLVDLSSGVVVFSNGVLGGLFSGYQKGIIYYDTVIKQRDFISGDQSYSHYSVNYCSIRNGVEPFRTDANGNLSYLSFTKTINLTNVNKIKLTSYSGTSASGNIQLLSADKKHRYSGSKPFRYEPTVYLDISAFTGYYFLHISAGITEASHYKEVVLLN